MTKTKSRNVLKPRHDTIKGAAPAAVTDSTRIVDAAQTKPLPEKNAVKQKN